MYIKKILSVLVVAGIAIWFSGCSQKITHVDKQEFVSSLDFSKYQKDGFLITPGEFGENYTSLGIFTFKVTAEMNYKIKSNSNQRSRKTWQATPIKTQEILDLAYETAKEKGADAITHFKMKLDASLSNDGQKSFAIPYYEISGLLIKRNN